MIIYLVGFMGSGKSTIGRRMASRAKWKFEDLDLLIEKKAGMTADIAISAKKRSCKGKKRISLMSSA